MDDQQRHHAYRLAREWAGQMDDTKLSTAIVKRTGIEIDEAYMLIRDAESDYVHEQDMAEIYGEGGFF